MGCHIIGTNTREDNWTKKRIGESIEIRLHNATLSMAMSSDTGLTPPSGHFVCNYVLMNSLKCKKYYKTRNICINANVRKGSTS